MTPAQMAALHQKCFETPRPWSEAEFATLLENSQVFLVTAPDGFALGQIAGPEVELLTIAVSPDARRRGIGKQLMDAFHAKGRARGADTAFLEVAANNTAACTLYARCGYGEAGRRPKYYRHPNGNKTDALVLRRPLADADASSSD